MLASKYQWALYIYNIIAAMIAGKTDSGIAISHETVTADSVLSACASAVSIMLEHCTSEDWAAVGKVLASLPQLSSLTLQCCNTGDAICWPVSQSQSLLRLRICTSQMTQHNVAYRNRESSS